MKSSLLGSIVLAASGIGGLVGAVAVARESQRQPQPLTPVDPGLERAVHGLAVEIGELQERISGIERGLAVGERVEVATVLPPAAASESTIPEAQTEATGRTDTPSALAAKLDELIAWGATAEEIKAFFASLRESGGQDEVVAALEDRVADDPNDAWKHYLLAKACYARLLLESTPAGYERWGERTVSAWDRAIALDPNYWEPRYERAEYFTYFPESEGKTPGLIVELEALIDLQAGSTANPTFANTYAHLARMYLRLGKTDEALQVLTSGAALFPEDVQLQDLLDALSDD